MRSFNWFISYKIFDYLRFLRNKFFWPWCHVVCHMIGRNFWKWTLGKDESMTLYLSIFKQKRKVYKLLEFKKSFPPYWLKVISKIIVSIVYLCNHCMWIAKVFNLCLPKEKRFKDFSNLHYCTAKIKNSNVNCKICISHFRNSSP